jgi:Cysteine-rich CPCC
VFENVSEPAEKRKTYRCPCCKFKTLYGRGGFEMCPVCWWEDDGPDEHEANAVRGGPNGTLSLRQAQENFKKFGASDEAFISKTRKPLPEEH